MQNGSFEQLLLTQQQLFLQIILFTVGLTFFGWLVLFWQIGKMSDKTVRRVSYVVRGAKKGDEEKMEGVIERFWGSVFEHLSGGEGGLIGAIRRALSGGKDKDTTNEEETKDLKGVPLEY